MTKMYVLPLPYNTRANILEKLHRYWDQTITGNSIMASRTSILETLPKVISSPPLIKHKSTMGGFQKFFFDIRGAIGGHKILSLVALIMTVVGGVSYLRRRSGRSRGGFFRLDEKDGLLGGNNGKVD
jgi:protein disulfide-isomerase